MKRLWLSAMKLDELFISDFEDFEFRRKFVDALGNRSCAAL